MAELPFQRQFRPILRLAMVGQAKAKAEAFEACFLLLNAAGVALDIQNSGQRTNL